MQRGKASSYAYKNKKTCQLATNTTMKDKFTGQYTFTQLCNVSFYVNTLVLLGVMHHSKLYTAQKIKKH